MILGILLIFGGPVVIISLVKLYCRDLSRFLEATGCAVNRRMRMSRKMGKIFTFLPPMPEGKKIRLKFAGRPDQGSVKRTLFGIIIALIIAAGCCAVWYMRGLERQKVLESQKCTPAAVVKKSAEAPKTAPAVKVQLPAPAAKAGADAGK